MRFIHVEATCVSFERNLQNSRDELLGALWRLTRGNAPDMLSFPTQKVGHARVKDRSGEIQR